MSDLDDRLREIPIDRDGQRYHLSSAELIWVKQAFADEGYERLGHHTTKKPGQKAELIMTGQEWYDKYKVATMGVMLETGTQDITRKLVFKAWDIADKAAKRAAGLS